MLNLKYNLESSGIMIFFKEFSYKILVPCTRDFSHI